MLDLVEHVADLVARRADPRCSARLGRSCSSGGRRWGGGKQNATTVLLEPLDAAESASSCSRRSVTSPQELHERIVDAAEGNPLFLEEMLALVRESPDGNVDVPPTIQALLAARLDQLDPAERSVLERGSIEGRTFHRGAVAALADGDRTGRRARCSRWCARSSIRPDRPQLPRRATPTASGTY